MDFENAIKESISQLNDYSQGNDNNVEVVTYKKGKRVIEKRNTWRVVFMIYNVKIDQDGVFFSQNRNTYEEALECAKENIDKYGELEIHKYYADGTTELIQTMKKL